VKRTALIKKVRAAARAAGLAFEVTSGGDHDKVVVGTTRCRFRGTRRSTN